MRAPRPRAAVRPYGAEEVRLSTVALDPAAFSEAEAAALKSDDGIGRLNIINHQGDTDGDAQIDEIVTYGGRGISIFKQNPDGTIVKVRETGGEFEKIIASLPDAATVFNGENGGAFDSRSDNKGPEPEGVDVATIGGHIYAFVGLERVGGVMVYDVTDPANASFVRYVPPTGNDYAPEVVKVISAADSPTGKTLVLTANEVSGSLTVYAAEEPPVEVDITPIYQIQGAGQTSSYDGQTVTTRGVVVARDANGSRGYYIQDAAGDGNANTSDAIFVFTNSSPTIEVGHLVEVTGVVDEYIPSGAARGSLSITEIVATSTGSVVDLGVSPDAVSTTVIGGAGGLLPPNSDLAAGNQFFETLEGMLVTVKAPVAVGPTNSFGEIFTVVDNDANPGNGTAATGQTARGNLLLTPGADSFGNTDTAGGDFNPERIQIDDDSGVLTGFASPAVNVGAHLSDVTGVVTYDFGNYQVVPTQAYTVTQPATIAKETASLSGDATHLLIASYNAENLDAKLEDPAHVQSNSASNVDDDLGTGKFDAIANQIFSTLHAPDIVAMQEIQDNDGAELSSVTSASQTLQILVDKINALAASSGSTAHYAYIDNPFINDDANGGQPGGNIRTAFIYREDRVSLVSDSLATLTADGTPITTVGGNTDQATNPDNPFYTSRPPLIATFAFNGQEVTVVNNHFASKSGSGALMGSEQPPFDGGEVQRAAQAQAVNNFVDAQLAADPKAKIVVAGDLNEFPFEQPIAVIKGEASISGYDTPGTDPFQATAAYTAGGAAVLSDLLDTLPADQRYDYVFEGNSETLDHILVSNNIAATTEFDVVRVNAEFADQTSDHDPLLARLDMSGNYTLQILHASDFEAGLKAVDRAGNFAAIVDYLEETYQNSITLSSGDNYIPSPFFSAGSDASLKEAYETALETYYNLAPGTLNISPGFGTADISMLNIIGIQASAIGNHEFDAGTNPFAAIIRQTERTVDPDGAAGPLPAVVMPSFPGAQFPYLAADLDFSGDSNLSGLYTGTIRDAEDFTGFPPDAGIGKKIAPATIINENGERIGVVGATTQIVQSISSTGGVEVIGDNVDDMPALAAILQPTIDALLAQGINKIVLVSHLQQLALEKELAPLLHGVDVIVAGGSHTLMADSEDVARGLQTGDTAAETYPYVTQNADGKALVIVNTASEYSYVGRLVVEFDANGDVIPSSIDPNVSGAFATTSAVVQSLYANSIDVNNDGDVDASDANPFAAGSRGDLVNDIAQAVGTVINAQDGNLFGKTDVYLEGRRGEVRTEETNLGDLSADANLWYAKKVDPTVLVSIKNGGGVRDSIGNVYAVGGESQENPPAGNPTVGKQDGDVSQLDIANSLRFNNALSLITVTSAQLLQVLEHAVAATTATATPGQFAQIGGISYSFDKDLPAGNRVISASLIDEDGNPIMALVRDGELVVDPSMAIRVVTLNFLIDSGSGAGGDNYPFYAFKTADPAFANVVNLTPALVPDAGQVAGFAAEGTEQDAFAEYMAANYSTTAYNELDTTRAEDTRIQNLDFRADTVLAAAAMTGTAAGDPLLGSDLDDTLDGQAGDDTLIGAGGNDLLIGGDGADLLQGGVGNDTLNGGAGPDILVGGPGDDTYMVDSVDDIVIERPNEGTDTVIASINYTLLPNFENLTLAQSAAPDGTVAGTAALNGTGNAANNVLIGNSAANILSGLGGNDTLDGRGGIDTLRGGDGDDVYVLDGADIVIEDPNKGTDRVEASISYTLTANVENLTLTGTAAINGTGNGLNNTITGNSAANTLNGLAGNDTLNGMAGDDTLDGGLGNDTLNGGVGNDTLKGGLGNDVYVLDDADIVIETAGGGTDRVEASISFTLAANVENLTLMGTAAINGAGNALSNTITGNSAANTLNGGVGNDTLNGLGGNDILNGDAGSDTLNGGEGNDTLNGGTGVDTMRGGVGDDLYIVDSAADKVIEAANEGTDRVEASVSYTLTANVENLTLTGTANINGAGNVLGNTLTGNIGANTLNGGAGNDTLFGMGGKDKLNGDAGNDTLNGGDGDDMLNGGGDNDTLIGAEGNDNLRGGNGNDVLEGGAGNDKLYGEAGDDLIDGGLGDDVLNGGLGNDTYLFHPGFGNDRIEGFGATDLINLSGFGFTSADSILSSLVQISNTKVRLDLPTGDHLTIEKPANLQLAAKHFVIDDAGPSTEALPFLASTNPQTTVESLLSAGDTVGGYTMAGVPDGLGAFDNGDGTFTVLMNHELANTLGAVHDHGAKGAFVSEWVIDKTTLEVVSGDDLVQHVFLYNAATDSYYDPVADGNPATAAYAFNRLCSADLPSLSAFYNADTGLGYNGRIFMNGEEAGAEGKAFAHFVGGAEDGNSYELAWLGNFSWENSVANPNSGDKTVVVGLDDSSPGQVYIYIGDKQSTGSAIDKAGLTDGHLFGVHVTELEGASNNNESDATLLGADRASSFSLVDLGDVSGLTGAQLQTQSEAAGVTEFLRPEDGAWDPTNEDRFYFVTTNNINGPSRLWALDFVDGDHPELGGTIRMLLDGTEGQKMLDNMTVTDAGKVILQEDVGNNAHLGKVWEYNPGADRLSQIAAHDPSQFLNGGANYLTQDEESSGVIDVTSILGSATESVYLLDTQAHYAVAGDQVEGGQLMLIRQEHNAAAALI